MSDDNKQAVVDESKAAAVPAATDDSARDNVDPLDKLLSQWDEDQKAKQAPVSPPVPPTQQPQDTISPERFNRVEQYLRDKELSEAISEIFGDMKVPRRAARGWLEEIARENPAIGLAYASKDRDPRTWDKFKRSLEREARQDFQPTQVDETVTADREAVAQAVRGASTTKVPAEPAPKLGNKSNAEFRKHVIDQYGFDPGV